MKRIYHEDGIRSAPAWFVRAAMVIAFVPITAWVGLREVSAGFRMAWLEIRAETATFKRQWNSAR